MCIRDRVYTVRRLSVDHAWKIAAASGAVVNIVVIVIGDIVFDIHTSYNMLIIGNIAAVVIGFIMEFFLFSVDYSRTERLQFEDDEYYYYVKAIPKISVTAPEKTVKHINERKETGEIAGTEPVSYTHLCGRAGEADQEAGKADEESGSRAEFRSGSRVA